MDPEEDEEAEVKPLIPLQREPAHQEDAWIPETQIQIEHSNAEQRAVLG